MSSYKVMGLLKSSLLYKWMKSTAAQFNTMLLIICSVYDGLWVDRELFHSRSLSLTEKCIKEIIQRQFPLGIPEYERMV